MIKNFRGEFHLSLWWIFCWIFVVGVIVLATATFYGKPGDIREAEAELLSNKISRCLFEQGVFDINEIKNKDIYDMCGFDRGVFQEGSYFYIGISIFDYERNSEVYEFSAGRGSYLGDCMAVGKKISAEQYPRCKYRNESVIYLEDNKLRKGNAEIITASGQYYLSKSGGLRNE